MNEETPCIINKGKTTKNEWKNDDSDYLPDLHKFAQILF